MPDILVSEATVADLERDVMTPHWELHLLGDLARQFVAAREVCHVPIPDGVLAFVARNLVAQGWRHDPK